MAAAADNVDDNKMMLKEQLSDNDNYVINYYKSTPGVCQFLLNNAYYALRSGRSDIIFEPYPSSWKIKFTKKAQLLDTVNIYDYVKTNQINDNVQTVISAIQSSYDDIELIEKINFKTYELVRFILESNKMMIKTDYLLKSTDMITIKNPDDITSAPVTKTSKTLEGAAVADSNELNILSSVLQFKLIHTQLVEDKFKDKETIYLYHGSPYENWYSIMRNGVKIGSDSKYFLNGAAYGKGVYLSNDINLSLGYSNRTHINKTDCQMILAIFEVINNPKWHKGGNIYVINDENALILRYLLVFNNIYDPLIQGVFKAINIKLNNGGIKAFDKEKKDMEAKNITTIHNKRLMREYQMIMKQAPEKLGFRIALAQEDNLGRWMVYITNPENPRLEEQMSRLNIPAIEIEITFKDTYPISPPFIRVVYPHFQFHSGHITVGGSLCMEMLTNQGWSPTFNVENVITQIKLAISDGGGAIDEANYKKRYTMEEAMDAFKRVLASHGWV